MRVTQSMVMNSYTNRLGRVFANMDAATQKVATNGRRFLSASEDPGGAARAYQLRASFQQTNDWISNVQDVIDSMDTLDSSIRVLVDMANHAHSKVLEARNDTWSLDDRRILAMELRSMQRTAIESLNVRFDDKHLFGGSSTKSLPFDLQDGPPQVLTFRGIDVMTTDPAERARLQEFADERIFIDIGFGLSIEEDGTVRPSSAFNIANPGIAFLGPIGTGDPTDNFILNLGVLADIIETEPFSHEMTDDVSNKLRVQHQDLLLAVTRRGADHNFLQTRLSVLENNLDDLNRKIQNVEFDDMEVSIMNMKTTEFIYRALLDMGARMLQPSFIDFMR